MSDERELSLGEQVEELTKKYHTTSSVVGYLRRSSSRQVAIGFGNRNGERDEMEMGGRVRVILEPLSVGGGISTMECGFEGGISVVSGSDGDLSTVILILDFL